MSDCLFVSFWDLCLENLPDGLFEKRELPAEDATAMIHAAVSAASIVWVSGEDLLAPYNQHVRRRHEELCSVLRSKLGWPVHVKDFLSSLNEDAQLVTARPLEMAEVSPNDPLLIVSCSYAFDSRPDRENDLQALFSIDHETLTFHVIRQVKNTGAVLHQS